MRRWLLLFAVELTLLLLLPSTVQAAQAEVCSLTVLGRGEFRLYRVAQSASEGSFILTDSFAASSLSLDADTAEEWRSLTASVLRYIAAQMVAADDVADTWATGQAVFSCLPPGLYLVVGDAGSKTAAFLLCLPGRDLDGRPQYAVTAQAKYEPDSDFQPGTGDDTGVVEWMLLAFFSAVGMLVLGICKRRK